MDFQFDPRLGIALSFVGEEWENRPMKVRIIVCALGLLIAVGTECLGESIVILGRAYPGSRVEWWYQACESFYYSKDGVVYRAGKDVNWIELRVDEVLDDSWIEATEYEDFQTVLVGLRTGTGSIADGEKLRRRVIFAGMLDQKTWLGNSRTRAYLEVALSRKAFLKALRSGKGFPEIAAADKKWLAWRRANDAEIDQANARRDRTSAVNVRKKGRRLGIID